MKLVEPKNSIKTFCMIKFLTCDSHGFIIFYVKLEAKTHILVTILTFIRYGNPKTLTVYYSLNTTCKVSVEKVAKDPQASRWNKL